MKKNLNDVQAFVYAEDPRSGHEGSVFKSIQNEGITPDFVTIYSRNNLKNGYFSKN